MAGPWGDPASCRATVRKGESISQRHQRPAFSEGELVFHSHPCGFPSGVIAGSSRGALGRSSGDSGGMLLVIGTDCPPGDPEGILQRLLLSQPKILKKRIALKTENAFWGPLEGVTWRFLAGTPTLCTPSRQPPWVPPYDNLMTPYLHLPQCSRDSWADPPSWRATFSEGEGLAPDT